MRKYSNSWSGRKLLLLGLALAFEVLPAWADEATATEARAKRIAKAEQLTAELVGPDHARAMNLPTQAMSGRAADQIATDRKSALIALLEDAPEEVLRLRIPETVRAMLPPKSLADVEHDVAIEGRLQVLVEDDERRSRMRYYLQGHNQHRYRLHFAGRPPKLLSNTQVIVQGVALDEHVVLQVAQLDGTATTGMLVSGAPVSISTRGPQPTLVLLVKDTLRDPLSISPGDSYTSNQINDLIFNSSRSDGVNTYFLEASYRKMWLGGQALDWQEVAVPTDAPGDDPGCPDDYIRDQALAWASSRVNLHDYKRFITIFTHQDGCRFSGLGTIGEVTLETAAGPITASFAWINGLRDSPLGANASVIAHELGHNFGLYHSNALDCGTNDPIDGPCTVKEYGDAFDVMGKEFLMHFNAAQKDRLGWFDPGEVAFVATELTGLALRPIAYQQGGVKAVKMSGPGDSWYYVEYRAPIGFDDPLGSGGPFVPKPFQGFLIHQVPSYGSDPELLDMTPESMSGSFGNETDRDVLDAGLLPGMAYVPRPHIGLWTRSATSSQGTLDVRGNQIPVARAGADQAAVLGTYPTLNGCGSSDGDGEPLTFAWHMRTSGGPVFSTACTATTPDLQRLEPITRTFVLEVSDGFSTGYDEVKVSWQHPIDLAVMSFVVTPSTPLSGQPTAFTAVIKNLSSNAAGASTAEFHFDADCVGPNPFDYGSVVVGVPALASGQEVTLSQTRTCAAGTHTATVETDINGVLIDGNPSNNTRSVTVTVSPFVARPDLTVTGVTTSPLPPAPNQPLRITWTVKNIGTAAAFAGFAGGGQVHWEVYNQAFGMRRGEAYIPPLYPGQTTTVVHDVPNAGPVGTSWLTHLAVDYGANFVESNESNNYLTLNYTVGQCHILTAAFGHPQHPIIQSLWETHHRLIGNQWNSPWHQAYLRWYDQTGPKIAVWLSDKPWLRAVVRAVVTPAAQVAAWCVPDRTAPRNSGTH